MEFNARVKALTQDYLLPKVVDNSLGGNVLSMRLMGNAKPGKGTSIDRAIKISNSETATSFAGLDTFAASQLDTKIKLSYDMRALRIPVGIAGTEAVANAVSETQVTDLVKEALEECQQELIDSLGTQLYGDGTGNSNKDMIGLGAIVDDGTDVSTIGGQSRTTYAGLKATRTASGGTLTLAKLATLDSAISSGTGTSEATIMVSDETGFDLYESLLTPTVRENYQMMGYYTVGRVGGLKRGEGLQGTAGFTALSYRGIPWVKDEKATAQNVFILNENHLQWYGWDAKGMFGYNKIGLGTSTIEGTHSEAPVSQFSGFNWSGFRAPTNQFAGIADVIIMGNLTSWSPRRQGRLTGVTSV